MIDDMDDIANYLFEKGEDAMANRVMTMERDFRANLRYTVALERNVERLDAMLGDAIAAMNRTAQELKK